MLSRQKVCQKIAHYGASVELILGDGFVPESEAQKVDDVLAEAVLVLEQLGPLLWDDDGRPKH